jgi:hypothetical protein
LNPFNLKDNLQILKDNGIQPSTSLLRSDPQTLKKNIQILKDNEWPLNRVTAALLSDPDFLSENLKALKEYCVKPSEFIQTSLLGLPPEEFKEQLPDLLKQKAAAYAMDMAKKGYFGRFISRCLRDKEREAFEEIGERMAAEGKQANEGEITKKEVRRIFNDYVKSPYPETAKFRLDHILKSLRDAGIWRKIA